MRSGAREGSPSARAYTKHLNVPASSLLSSSGRFSLLPYPSRMSVDTPGRLVKCRSSLSCYRYLAGLSQECLSSVPRPLCDPSHTESSLALTRGCDCSRPNVTSHIVGFHTMSFLCGFRLLPLPCADRALRPDFSSRQSCECSGTQSYQQIIGDPRQPERVSR